MSLLNLITKYMGETMGRRPTADIKPKNESIVKPAKADNAKPKLSIEAGKRRAQLRENFIKQTEDAIKEEIKKEESDNKELN